MKQVNLKTKILCAIFIILQSALSIAQDSRENLIYAGTGPAKTASATDNSSTPFSLGYINLSKVDELNWGFDIGGEGTKLDSTWGQTNSLNQAHSYNLLIGKKISTNSVSRLDASILVGFRDSTSECPKSYLGYQCYANTTPTNSYAFNYGALLTWTYNQFLLGARATGESTQILIGIRF